jgi:hypothetical protein
MYIYVQYKCTCMHLQIYVLEYCIGIQIHTVVHQQEPAILFTGFSTIPPSPVPPPPNIYTLLAVYPTFHGMAEGKKFQQIVTGRIKKRTCGRGHDQGGGGEVMKEKMAGKRQGRRKSSRQGRKKEEEKEGSQGRRKEEEREMEKRKGK